MERPPGDANSEELRAQARALVHCEPCGSDLVQLADWQEAGLGYWCLTLRCPNCEGIRVTYLSDDVLQYYDSELERGAVELERALAEMVDDRIESDVRMFAGFLREDLILPEDF